MKIMKKTNHKVILYMPLSEGNKIEKFDLYILQPLSGTDFCKSSRSNV